MPEPLYPLTFEPIFKSMLWGGRRLPSYLGRNWTTADPIGEAWVLSDVDGSESRVMNGPLAGRTLRELVAAYPQQLLGRASAQAGRFPLLLKFIDAKRELSVQVHPNDEQAQTIRPDLFGKTEAWVILDADPTTSRIYSGFKAGIGAKDFHTALAAKQVPDTLHSFTPSPGDCVFLDAGTVHAIGADLLLFEVQQTSDITYRLYDWDRVDARTGLPRELHMEEGLRCANFDRGPCHPVTATREDHREHLATCNYFTLHRTTSEHAIPVGKPGTCTIVVVIAGEGRLGDEELRPGSVVLLPAEHGTDSVRPLQNMTILECGIPEG